MVLAGAVVSASLLVGCGEGDAGERPFTVGAIPDQDPERLQRLYGLLTEHLERELEVPVEYKPVTDYAASVTAFRVGDLDMVWFGGLTGVQARLQVDGARAFLHRDIDGRFRSVFIAHGDAGLGPFRDPAELRALEGRTFTFGSESSTSGRLMPQHFLNEAGVELSDFRGRPGFSGSHDRTIRLVESGSYEAGVVNEQVWDARVEAGEVDTTRVREIWRTPTYYNYHWVVRPGMEERYGSRFLDRLRDAFTTLSLDDPGDRQILELFGARSFVPTEDANYEDLESVARRIGKIR